MCTRVRGRADGREERPDRKRTPTRGVGRWSGSCEKKIKKIGAAGGGRRGEAKERDRSGGERQGKMKERREGSERWTNERRKRAEDRRDREGEKDHVRMCDTGERETERMLEAIFRWRGGERRMGSRRRRG